MIAYFPFAWTTVGKFDELLLMNAKCVENQIKLIGHAASRIQRSFVCAKMIKSSSIMINYYFETKAYKSKLAINSNFYHIGWPLRAGGGGRGILTKQ